MIHSNVWRPSCVPTKGGSRYYVSFINDHTHYYWVYLMKHCYEFFEIYKAFRALLKLNILPLLNVSDVIWVGSTLLINFLSCLP